MTDLKSTNQISLKTLKNLSRKLFENIRVFLSWPFLVFPLVKRQLSVSQKMFLVIGTHLTGA